VPRLLDHHQRLRVHLGEGPSAWWGVVHLKRQREPRQYHHCPCLRHSPRTGRLRLGWRAICRGLARPPLRWHTRIAVQRLLRRCLHLSRRWRLCDLCPLRARRTLRRLHQLHRLSCGVPAQPIDKRRARPALPANASSVQPQRRRECKRRRRRVPAHPALPAVRLASAANAHRPPDAIAAAGGR